MLRQPSICNSHPKVLTLQVAAGEMVHLLPSSLLWLRGKALTRLPKLSF